MKDIIKNYIPNQYKIRSKKKITTRTIKRGLYILLATFLLQIFYYVFGNDIVIDKLLILSIIMCKHSSRVEEC